MAIGFGPTNKKLKISSGKKNSEGFDLLDEVAFQQLIRCVIASLNKLPLPASQFDCKDLIIVQRWNSKKKKLDPFAWAILRFCNSQWVLEPVAIIELYGNGEYGVSNFDLEKTPPRMPLLDFLEMVDIARFLAFGVRYRGEKMTFIDGLNGEYAKVQRTMQLNEPIDVMGITIIKANEGNNHN